MPEAAPLSPATDSFHEDAVQQEWTRRVVATFLSTVVPGSGQLILGRRRRGAVLLVLYLLCLFGFWPLRLPRLYFAFVLLVMCSAVLSIYASCETVLFTPPGQRRISRAWLFLILPLSLVAMNYVLAFALRASGFREFVIPSNSMENTIMQGDHIMTDLRYFSKISPSRQQIVILDRNKTLIVKRVIAVGGDIIAGSAGKIFLNGNVISEPYVKHVGSPSWSMTHFGPIVVSPDSYFVMGDNRDVSYDSRQAEVGCVPRESIVGVPLYVLRAGHQGPSLN